MLLGKKSKYMLDSEWAIVLDRSTNEFLKHKAVEKLTELFSLSSDEAKELIENTPIILLDHLPFELASKIKDHFTQVSIDCSVTNDTFTKRKCFRAVWPEQPDLSRFFTQGTPPREHREEMDYPSPRPVVSEVPRVVDLDPKELTPNLPEPISSETFRPPIDEQKELKDLTLELQKENEMLKYELDKLEGSVKEREEKRFQAEIDKFKFERAKSEELLTRLRSENISLTKKIEELERKVQLVKQATEAEAAQVLKQQTTELKAQIESFRSEYLRAQSAVRVAQSEAKQFQMELAQAQKAVLDTRSEIEDLKRMLSQAQANAVHLKEEAERARTEVESRLEAQGAELEEWKRKANDWSSGYFKAVKENEFLRAHQSEELESLRARNQQLGIQLEQAQRQIKDFVGKLEQQELIQKRMKAVGELAEKEAQLRTLVQKQQTLESEICSREEEMKKILGEQEVIEQDIVKAKQAQKYLLEQAKLKDRPRVARPKSFGSPDSGRQEPESPTQEDIP